MTTKSSHVDAKQAATLRAAVRPLVASIPPTTRKAWAAELREHNETGAGFRPGWFARQLARLNPSPPNRKKES